MLVPHAPRAAGDALPAQPAPITTMDTRPPAIVLVEDEPDVLYILHRLMRDMVFPYALIAVASGQAALHQLALYSVSLVITDYNMPGMNGLQLAHAVKDASPNTRVVLITAYNTPELKRQVRSSGVDEYLAKPFSLDRIEQIVRDSLL